MLVLICPDSFKESLTAAQAAQAIREGFTCGYPGARFLLCPVADGGEGTVEAFLASGGSRQTARVTGPLGSLVEAEWALLENGSLAVIEMAQAAGLGLVPKGKRNPFKTTTRGVGELLLKAASCGVKKIIMGIGGSATNDGGAGMAEALGYSLLDASGNPIPPGAEGLLHLHAIRPPKSLPPFSGIEITVACDVTNPLLGPNGASSVYGPQKGATPRDIPMLDQALERWAGCLQKLMGRDVRDQPGAGAAGGLGAGLLALLGASLKPGFSIISNALNLPSLACKADIILTGEGKTDPSSLSGKVVSGVLSIAREQAKPAIILSGAVESPVEQYYQAGASGVFSMADGVSSKKKSMAGAAELLSSLARAVGSTVACTQNISKGGDKN